MLISRKLTKDTSVVTDFRHLNEKILKNNLAYPLLKDIFSVLGSSKYEVLLVLDLKDAFHSLRLLAFECKDSKEQLSLPFAERYILSVKKFQMWGIISSRFKRHIPFIEMIRKLQKILWNTPLFWQHIVSISEDAHRIKHIPLHMAILYQCNTLLCSKQKIL